jgi:hypothetical protein
MDDLALTTAGRAVRTAQGWAVYHGTDSNSEKCGFGEPASFSDIADAIVAIENRQGFGQARMGNETPRGSNRPANGRRWSSTQCV